MGESAGLAHRVPRNPERWPPGAVGWVGHDGDEIVSGHLDPGQQKVRNIARDPRVAVSIESDVTNAMGLREYLVVHGTARLQEGGAADLLQRLAHVYLGPDVRFPPMDDPPSGVVARTTVERIGGVGDWRA
ncbi:MAG: pyridoxamine 5'-phosphate oxidase family protein [Actinobacteria bacterium]|nr:pyridoxamine 5'-phosphate oxidase family protein [Actinomycetota bacterium]